MSKFIFFDDENRKPVRFIRGPIAWAMGSKAPNGPAAKPIIYNKFNKELT